MLNKLSRGEFVGIVAVLAVLLGSLAYWGPEIKADWKFLHAARVQNDILLALPRK